MHTLADAYRQIRPQYWESRNAKNAAIALYGMATGTQRWALEKTINDIEFYLDLHPRIIFTMREISRFYRHQFYKIDHNNNLAESNCGLVFKFDRGTEQDRISETHLSYLYTRKSQRLELVQLDRVNNQTFMSSPSPYG